MAKGHIEMFSRHEMMDLVLVDGEAKGIVTRNLVTGEIKSYAGDTVLLCTGGYGNVFFLSTNAMGCNVTAAYKAYKRGAFFANPCFTQIHPTCIPVKGDYQSKLTLMSESLRNSGRIWVPKSRETAEKIRKKEIKPSDVPEEERDYYLERKYPSFGNLAPRDISSRAAKEACDDGRGVAVTGKGVFLDFADEIKRMGREWIDGQYGNLFDMYEEITDDDPHETPMMIYPASHYTMGGLWVDYNLMSNVKGLHVLGEANFSDHGANRLGASALMQGLADGYFVLPYTIQNYLSDQITIPRFSTSLPEFVQAEKDVNARIAKLMSIKGKRSVDSIHKELGLIMWEYVGMGRTKESLETALEKIKEVKKEFWTNVRIPGEPNSLNVELEKALRLADFIEIGRLMALDALNRNESCGGHFREEFQTPDGEALRQDDKYMYVSCWEYQGEDKDPVMYKEELKYEAIKVQQRNYKQ